MNSLISRKRIFKQSLCVSTLLFYFLTFGAAQDNTDELLDTEDAEVGGVIGVEGGRLELDDGTYVEFKSGIFTSDTNVKVSTSVIKPEIPEGAIGALSKFFGLPVIDNQRLEEKFTDIARYTTIDISAVGLSDSDLLKSAVFNVHLPANKPYAYYNSAIAIIHLLSDEDYIGSTIRQYRNLPPTEENVSRLIDVPIGDAVALSPSQNSMSAIIIVKGLKDPPPPRDVEQERNGG